MKRQRGSETEERYGKMCKGKSVQNVKEKDNIDREKRGFSTMKDKYGISKKTRLMSYSKKK